MAADGFDLVPMAVDVDTEASETTAMSITLETAGGTRGSFAMDGEPRRFPADELLEGDRQTVSVHASAGHARRSAIVALVSDEPAITVTLPPGLDGVTATWDAGALAVSWSGEVEVDRGFLWAADEYSNAVTVIRVRPGWVAEQGAPDSLAIDAPTALPGAHDSWEISEAATVTWSLFLGHDAGDGVTHEAAWIEARFDDSARVPALVRERMR